MFTLFTSIRWVSHIKDFHVCHLRIFWLLLFFSNYCLPHAKTAPHRIFSVIMLLSLSVTVSKFQHHGEGEEWRMSQGQQHSPVYFLGWTRTIQLAKSRVTGLSKRILGYIIKQTFCKSLEDKVINHKQYGFVRIKSCLTNLTSFYDRLGEERGAWIYLP